MARCLKVIVVMYVILRAHERCEGIEYEADGTGMTWAEAKVNADPGPV